MLDRMQMLQKFALSDTITSVRDKNSDIIWLYDGQIISHIDSQMTKNYNMPNFILLALLCQIQHHFKVKCGRFFLGHPVYGVTHVIKCI